jgi:hypothetical protein
MLYLQKHNNTIKKISKLLVFLITTYFIINNTFEGIAKEKLINSILLFGTLYIVLDNYIPTY